MYAADKCKYFMELPVSLHQAAMCRAYSVARMNNGKMWGYFPVCNEEHCPLKHPELLNGGTLPEFAD